MDNEYILTSDGQLYHWGIKGMKWGVRRYQNADGSLTKAGKSRYDEKMSSIKAKTEKARAKQEAKQAKQDRKDALKAAKQELADVRKGKKVGKSDTPEETDDQKRDRILKSPTPENVYKNRHLFSNNEIQALSIRLMNEQNIKNLVPKQVSKGKQFADKTIENAETLTRLVDSGSKTWNSVAKVYNSLIGNKNGVELPTISDKTVSKIDKYKSETDWIKAKNERKKAEKEANDEKSELEKIKEETERIKAENENRKAKHTREQYDRGNWNNKEDKTSKDTDNEKDEKEKEDDD